MKHIIIAAVCAVMLSGCGGVIDAAHSGWERQLGDPHLAFAREEKVSVEIPICGLTVRFPNMPSGGLSPAEMREAAEESPIVSYLLDKPEDSESCRNWRASHQASLELARQVGFKPICAQVDSERYLTLHYYEWGMEIIVTVACP